ncbi:uncharacterized protein HMPREF1541_02009 [Cyphellophora europaea CBS 101466]|uniref:O-methyltransferase domain-containing protein n=1 Tax=Cyphellophora europaea (strain CBS 101466) TaxID=1220924 RepID=W2S2B5_CYPE1|nr:uncharacterized protein HMPREF1541_02009 [Cyphellophora europaea CBS 101466]ETN42851.1 hypothetical protein HMPREF1541_02009 [Cyphellophora europaea CBS 101466]
MDAQIAEIKKLYDQSDESGRIAIKESLHDLVNSLEGPRGTMYQTFNAFVQLAVIRVGINIGLFGHLQSSIAEPLSVDELAEKTGAAPQLLGT